jgi:hypothetical protein
MLGVVEILEAEPTALPNPAAGDKPSSTLKDFCLRPVGHGSDRLREFFIPCLPASPRSAEITVGRTAILAGEYQAYISREHVVFTVKEGALYLRSRAQEGCVHVNSRAVDISADVAIQEGDVVCLLGPKEYFNLKLSIIDHVDPPPAKKRLSTDGEASGSNRKRRPKNSPSSAAEASPIVHSGVGAGAEAGAVAGTGIGAGAGATSSGGGGESEDVKSAAECAICLELMAVAYSVVPCGHNFCYACISLWLTHNKKCPTCSCVVSNKIPCRVLDDIIQSTVVTKQATDVTHFERRYAEGFEASKKNAGAASKPAAPKNKIRNFFEVVDLS